MENRTHTMTASSEREIGHGWRAERGLARVAQSSAMVAVGALAVGAVAVGALAIGALAIGRLAIGRGRIRRLAIAELDVGRLRVRELITSTPFPPRSDDRVRD